MKQFIKIFLPIALLISGAHGMQLVQQVEEPAQANSKTLAAEEQELQPTASSSLTAQLKAPVQEVKAKISPGRVEKELNYMAQTFARFSLLGLYEKEHGEIADDQVREEVYEQAKEFAEAVIGEHIKPYAVASKLNPSILRLIKTNTALCHTTQPEFMNVVPTPLYSMYITAWYLKFIEDIENEKLIAIIVKNSSELRSIMLELLNKSIAGNFIKAVQKRIILAQEEKQQ